MQYVLSAYYCCVEWTLGCLRLNSLEHQFSRVGCYIRDSKDGSGTNGSQTLTQFDNLRRNFQYEPRSRSLTGPIFNLRSVLTGNTFTSLVVEQVNRTKELFRNQANQKQPTGNVVHIENYALKCFQLSV